MLLLGHEGARRERRLFGKATGATAVACTAAWLCAGLLSPGWGPTLRTGRGITPPRGCSGSLPQPACADCLPRCASTALRSHWESQATCKHLEFPCSLQCLLAHVLPCLPASCLPACLPACLSACLPACLLQLGRHGLVHPASAQHRPLWHTHGWASPCFQVLLLIRAYSTSIFALQHKVEMYQVCPPPLPRCQLRERFVRPGPLAHAAGSLVFTTLCIHPTSTPPLHLHLRRWR